MNDDVARALIRTTPLPRVDYWLLMLIDTAAAAAVTREFVALLQKSAEVC